MKRRMNFTGRKKIYRNQVEVHLDKTDSGELQFILDLNWDNMEVPSTAEVAIEAYVGSNVQRFDLGTLGSVEFPITKTLSEFFSDVVYFRIKLINREDGLGKLLASCSGVSAGIGGKRTSLLPVAYRDLGDLIWRINFDRDVPHLEINRQYRSDIPIADIVQGNPGFQALVFPAVLEELLTHILIINEHTEIEGDEWQSQWLFFASLLPGVKSLEELPPRPMENVSDYEVWIEDAVDSFCRRHDLKKSFEKAFGG